MFGKLGLVLVLSLVGCKSGSEKIQAAPSPATSPPKANSTEFGFYGVPIVSMNGSWKERGFANAVLVDRELGIFATNAHVVASGSRFKVRIENGWYGVRPLPNCISWHADLALVQISRLDRFVLPKAAELEWRQFQPGEKFTVVSHVVSEWDGKRLSTGFQTVHVRLLKQESDWGVSLASVIERLELRLDRLKGVKIPKEEVHKLYEHFLALELTEESRKQFPYPQQALGEGTSGSQVVDKNGRVVAIHSSANTGRSVAIPAYEVQRLLKKYRREAGK